MTKVIFKQTEERIVIIYVVGEKKWSFNLTLHLFWSAKTNRQNNLNEIVLLNFREVS